MEGSPSSLRWAFRVDTWCPDDDEWALALGRVSSVERERILRYRCPHPSGGVSVGRHNTNALASLVGWLMLHNAASKMLGLSSRQVEFARTATGKPYVVQSESVLRDLPSLSVSHDGIYTVLACEKEGDLVGVDVMAIEMSPKDHSLDEFFHSFPHVFTAQEWTEIHSGHMFPSTGATASPTRPPQLHRFFQNWTLKEAFVKALGEGIGFGLERVEMEATHGREGILLVLDGVPQPSWRLSLHYLDPFYVVAVAVRRSDVRAEDTHSSAFCVVSYDDLL